jgi:hypothetical protein
MAPRENADHEVVAVDTPLKAPRSAIHERSHEAEAGFGISQVLLQARLRQLLASTNIRRERRRRKQSVKRNEDDMRKKSRRLRTTTITTITVTIILRLLHTHQAVPTILRTTHFRRHRQASSLNSR